MFREQFETIREVSLYTILPLWSNKTDKKHTKSTDVIVRYVPQNTRKLSWKFHIQFLLRKAQVRFHNPRENYVLTHEDSSGIAELK